MGDKSFLFRKVERRKQELFTTNDLSRFYNDLPPADQKSIARDSFNTIPRKLITWLHCLTILRNYCAHYSRLYYTLFTATPLLDIELFSFFKVNF